jgi:hypothetical protein
MKKIPQFNAHLDKDSYSKEEVQEIIETFNRELPHVVEMCADTPREDTFFAKFVSYISLITTLFLLLFK